MSKKYELTQIGDTTYYVSGPSNVGVYVRNDNTTYLIDSGFDMQMSEAILDIVNDNGWQLRGIIVTHAHTDHTAGCHFISKATGCDVFANGIEASIVRHPVLDTAMLYGGYPSKQIRDDFHQSAPCPALDFSSPLFPTELKVIKLPGHYYEMCGIMTPDSVMFVADAVCSERILQKAGLTYVYDVESYLTSLDKLDNIAAKLYVAAHARPTSDITTLTIPNRNKVYEIRDMILNVCHEPHTDEDVAKVIFDTFGLKVNTVSYMMITSTVRSFLSWMSDCGKLQMGITDGRLLWQTIV